MSRLSLYLLGSPRVERDDLPINVDTRKAIALLAYIAVTRQSHRRDSLVNLLWPDYDRTRGRTNLRRTLYVLRKALAGEWLDIDRETVCLNANCDIWLDVDQFHSYLAECATHGHSAEQVCSACLAPLTSAVTLYRGDFLSGFSLKDSCNFDDWQSFQTESLVRELATAMERLVHCHINQGALEAAINHTRRWLTLDALNEAAHSQLMLLYDWSGQRAAALRQYQTCVRILKDELNASPQAATTALRQAIMEGRAPGPPIGLDVQQRAESVLDRSSAVTAIDGAEAPLTPPPSRERKTVGVRSSVIVARERELAQLCGYLDATLAGEGRVVFITGGPGRGKTALIQEFARRAQGRSADLIFAGGNCNAHTGFGDPYLPFREILSLLTGDVDARWHAGAITLEHGRRLWDTFPHTVEALVEVGPDLIDTFIPGPTLVRRAAAYTAGGLSHRVTWLAQLEELVQRKTAVPQDPNLGQSALFEQYVRTMATIARNRPLLLTLDDLQWADIGSISLLFHLGREAAGQPILIVGAYRPEELAVGPSLKGFLQHPGSSNRPLGAAVPVQRTGEPERHPLESVVHELQRTFGDIVIDLARAEGRRFVEAYLDTEPNRLGRDFCETLFRRTKGHPLFTVELLHGMQERGDLVQDDQGRWVAGPALDWQTLPARVEAVIAERIDRLDVSSRDALRVASVEGETFTAEVVARVMSAKEREVVECLSDELGRRHRLVRAHEIQRLGTRRVSRYRFRHILFQNYVYQCLDEVERAHLHEAVGVALEALHGEETEEIDISLARHFQEAGITEKAINYLLQAGERAKRGSANAAAIAHLTSGLEMLATWPESPERARLELKMHVALGIPVVLTKGHAAPEVERVYNRAWELCEQVGDAHQRFEVLLGLRRYYLHRGELQTALMMGEQLLDLAQREREPALLARAHAMQGESLYRMGQFPPAEEHYRQGIALSDPNKHHSHLFRYGNDTRALSQVFQGLALWMLGYPDQALQTSLEGLSRAQELKHPFTLVCARYFVALLHHHRREETSVSEQLQPLLQICQERAFALYSAWGAVLKGRMLAEQDAIEEGISQMREGLAAWREMGAGLLLPNFLLFLAEAYGNAGQIDDGLRLAAEALAAVEETGERTYEAELHRRNGELLLMKGQLETKAGLCVHQAEVCFLAALEVARRQSAKSWELRAAMSLSHLWHSQGKKTQARELLQETYSWFTEGFDTRDLKEAKALLDLLN